MDGDIIRVSKEFGVNANRITAQINCKTATQELSVTLKAHSSDMQATQLASHRDDHGDWFPTGRLKSKNTTPMPLDYWFMMDGSGDSATWLVSTKSQDLGSQAKLASLMLRQAMTVKALGGYDFDAHGYGMPGEGSFFYFNLPWVIELSSEGGAVELEIPAGDPNIEELATACKVTQMPRKDPEFFIDQTHGMVNSDVDVIEARLQDFHKTHPKIDLVVTTATDSPQASYSAVANNLIGNSTFTDEMVQRRGTNTGNVVLFIDPPNHRATVVTTKQVWSNINLAALVNETVIARITAQASSDFETQPILKVMDHAVSTLIAAIDGGEAPRETAVPVQSTDTTQTAGASHGEDASNNAAYAVAPPPPATPVAPKPSFDCSKASSTVEKMICANAELAAADAALGASYSKAKSSKTDLGWLRSSQRQFLQTRDACQAVACVMDSYHARQSELDRLSSTN